MLSKFWVKFAKTFLITFGKYFSKSSNFIFVFQIRYKKCWRIYIFRSISADVRFSSFEKYIRFGLFSTWHRLGRYFAFQWEKLVFDETREYYFWGCWRYFCKILKKYWKFENYWENLKNFDKNVRIHLRNRKEI